MIIERFEEQSKIIVNFKFSAVIENCVEDEAQLPKNSDFYLKNFIVKCQESLEDKVFDMVVDEVTVKKVFELLKAMNPSEFQDIEEEGLMTLVNVMRIIKAVK